jgi:hypothetical protein
MSGFPSHLVSEIVALSNGTDKKNPVVIAINPETGAQQIETNPHLVDRLKTSVKDSAILINQHRRLFALQKQIDEKIEEEEDLEEDEFIDDPDYFRAAIAEFAAQDPEITDLVRHAAMHYHCCFVDEDFDRDGPIGNGPIEDAFYLKAFEIVAQLSGLSPKMRVTYLAQVIAAIHEENPELDLGIWTFVKYYTKNTLLFKLANANLAVEERPDPRENTSLEFYEPIQAYSRDTSLDILKWANRSKGERVRWLSIVQGKEENEENEEEKRCFAKFERVCEMMKGLTLEEQKALHAKLLAEGF